MKQKTALSQFSYNSKCYVVILYAVDCACLDVYSSANMYVIPWMDLVVKWNVNFGTIAYNWHVDWYIIIIIYKFFARVHMIFK